MTAWPQESRARSIHHVFYIPDIFFFCISVRFIIYTSDLRTTYVRKALRVNIVVECSPTSVQCAYVTRFASHSTAHVVAAATTTAKYTQSRYSCYYYSCCWHRLLFLWLPLSYFCPCHAVAYLAASVVAKNAETGVKHPAFTDPPDDTEILQIIQK